MADDSIAPPSNSGGLKYAALGLLLLGAAAVLFFLLVPTGPDESTVAQAPDAGQAVERSTSLSTGFDLGDDVEEMIIDAGQADAGQAPTQPEKTRQFVPRQRCSGTLDQSAIARVVGQNRRQVRACYERALKQNNLLQGRISVRLQIGNGGAVQNVTVGGSLRSPQVSQCVTQLARGWQFPSPSGGCVMVDVPFNMTPRE